MGVMIPTPLVTWLASDIPGIKLGFTSRHGGYSSGDFATLNLGFHVPDDPKAVARNRALLATELGTDVVWMDQIHSDIVVDVATAHMIDAGELSVGKADAIIAETNAVGAEGISIAVMVADCIPLLIADNSGKRVAAVHVGRAGMDLGIALKVVDSFCASGSSPNDLIAVAGPAICGHCYEVSADLANDIGQRHPASVVETRWQTPGIDVRAGLREQLRTRNVELLSIETCTYENHDYFSHRRATHEERDTGRFAGIIRISPKKH